MTEAQEKINNIEDEDLKNLVDVIADPNNEKEDKDLVKKVLSPAELQKKKTKEMMGFLQL